MILFEQAFHEVINEDLKARYFGGGIVKNFLLNAYTEEYRKYHNLSHIERGLKHFYEYRNSPEYDSTLDKTAILYAWLFHDVVYNIGSKENESASSMIALSMLRFLNCEPPPFFDEFVDYCIMDTLHNTDNAIIDASAVVRDMDLADMGTDRFWENGVELKEEFANTYTYSKYCEGTIKLFEMLLNRPRIYLTDYFYNKYEKEARINLGIGIAGMKEDLKYV